MPEQDKREKIVAAALKVLSESGYDCASTKEIARTAGVAQGLVNYYFSSKVQLFQEVFRRETTRFCENLKTMDKYIGRQLTADTLKEIFSESRSSIQNNPNWYRLRYELYAIGLREGETSGILKETLCKKRELIGVWLEKLTRLSEEETKTLASILHATIDGLSLQQVVDPEFDYSRAFDMVADMLTAYLDKVVPE